MAITFLGANSGGGGTGTADYLVNSMGASANDTVVISIFAYYDISNEISTPSGFVLAGSNPDPTGGVFITYYKKLTANDISWAFTWSTSCTEISVCLAFRSVHTTSAIDASWQDSGTQWDGFTEWTLNEVANSYSNSAVVVTGAYNHDNGNIGHITYTDDDNTISFTSAGNWGEPEEKSPEIGGAYCITTGTPTYRPKGTTSSSGRVIFGSLSLREGASVFAYTPITVLPVAST